MVFRPTPPLWAKYAVLSQMEDKDLLFYFADDEYDDAIAKAKSLWKGAQPMYNVVFQYGLNEVVFQLGVPVYRMDERAPHQR